MFTGNSPSGSASRTYVIEADGVCVECRPVTAARTAEIAKLAAGARFAVPGRRTSICDPLVAAIAQDIDDLRQMDCKVTDDVEAVEDVLTNDLSRHLDELIAGRRERLLVGITETGEDRQMYAVFVVVPQFIESCRIYVKLNT